MLNGTPERKAMVKAAFNSIVIVPPQTFINSNLPRVRQSELLTPSELMMFLHDLEKDVGLKQAIEGMPLFRDGFQRFIIVSDSDRYLLLHDRCLQIGGTCCGNAANRG